MKRDKSKGFQPKPKNCVKGKSCRNTCIRKTLNCKFKSSLVANQTTSDLFNMVKTARPNLFEGTDDGSPLESLEDFNKRFPDKYDPKNIVAPKIKTKVEESKNKASKIDPKLEPRDKATAIAKSIRDFGYKDKVQVKGNLVRLHNGAGGGDGIIEALDNGNVKMFKVKKDLASHLRDALSPFNEFIDQNSSVIIDFNNAVNMTPKELEDWLDTDEAKKVGFTYEGDRDSVGYKSGRKIVKILQTKKENLTSDDIKHMKKVIGYIARHSARVPKNPENSPWLFSLRNWGFDPLK